MFKHLLIAIFCVSSLMAEPLVVRLDTEANLLPISVSEIQNDKAAFSKEYLAELSKVLLFDIDQGGLAERVKDSNRKTPYALTVKVSGKQLQAELQSNSTTKALVPVELSGKLNADRVIIHQFTDKVHKTLFGQEGIAKTKILYTLRQKKADQNDWTSDIWEMDYDGANARPIISNAGYLVTPQYVPEKRGMRPHSFVYVSYINGIPKIYSASLHDGKGRRLSPMKGNQLMPTWSQDKEALAFISDAAGNPDLFIIRSCDENKPKQVFSTKWGSQGTPAFSPDGKSIAFVSNKDGSPRIYSVDISRDWNVSTDLSPKLITKFRRGCTAPAWSPDGKKLAYSAPVDGVQQIFVYDMERDAEIQLTSGPGSKENPSFAPNSLHIVFNCNQGTRSDICIVNLNQKKIAKITSGEHEKRFPHWEPFSS